MAITYDLSIGSAGVPASGLNKGYIISNTIDLSDMDTKPVSTDVIQALKIGAKTYVQNVFVEIVTASAATTLTATVGDGTDPNGWDTAVDLEGTAGTITYALGALTDGTPNVFTDAYANGIVYSAADTIDLVMTVDTVTTWGVIKVSALCYDLS